MTAFSLPWYAAIGVSAALAAGLPDIAAVAIGVVGPTAGRFLIDITAGKSAKQFVRGEWFVGTAVLTSVVYLVLLQVSGADGMAGDADRVCRGLHLPHGGDLVLLGRAVAARSRSMSRAKSSSAPPSRRKCNPAGSLSMTNRREHNEMKEDRP